MLSHAFVPDSLQPHGLQPARLLCPWNSLGQEYWSRLPFPPPGDVPNPGIKPRSPALQADSLSSEPPGKPKNTGMGSLSLLQGIFWIQELNQGLLHCRLILYQLSPRTLHNTSPHLTLLTNGSEKPEAMEDRLSGGHLGALSAF